MKLENIFFVPGSHIASVVVVPIEYLTYSDVVQALSDAQANLLTPKHVEFMKRMQHWR